MSRNECVAMILAGGRGERLGALGGHVAKPMISFGGDYKIIDFTLSNCKNSRISNVGLLTQYQFEAFHEYINTGQWGLSDISLLPSSRDKPYLGTADAIYQRMEFIDRFHPEYVLILSGDHIYRMDYRKMIAFHQSTGGAVTIAATKVPLTQASRFGMINADSRGLIEGFEEKPKMPKSNLASMGIYVFNWKKLKKQLILDNADSKSKKDFGRNILPAMLSAGEKLYAYPFGAYWRDVGTIQSLWEANMDLLRTPPLFTLFENKRNGSGISYQISRRASIQRSIISDNCCVLGSVHHSILSGRVCVSEGAEVVDSVIMSNVFIGRNTKVHRAIIGPDTFIGVNVVIGGEKGTDTYVDRKMCGDGISLVAPRIQIYCGLSFQKHSLIHESAIVNKAAGS